MGLGLGFVLLCKQKQGSLSANALRAFVYVGGHFRIIQKWRTLSIFAVFCPFSREKKLKNNWHKLRTLY